MTDETTTLRPLTDSQMEGLDGAVSRYETAVGQAEGYLAGRGISRETAQAFRLGVVVDPEPGHQRMKGMLAIPYLDAEGRPLTIRFRCMENHNHRDFYHGKYNSLPGDPVRMFNVGAIHRAGKVIHLTEGEFDAMILNQEGFPAVGAPGAMSWKARHRKMLAGFSRVYLWGDPDEAGAELVQKVQNQVRQTKPLRLTVGDVSDTYMAGGRDALLAVLNGEES